ncbi:hypothetical protein [Candidatus Magnetominusculus xianensis]|uniref:Lipoprotein n=1 Tax=Candidatus Magnetominusculus xianensis TaxID=1748249 RepID=A0ABR5SIY2_9BACT|nr:hypothetical protein [Candidatus Magnetominusculus xianensis]KWT91706.1 hypothetical protein ASN18_0824 [Candidatus Magnetominusculus xianensis]MBF0404540.1 hypothetical protein [Nitrospirota bacterium]
MRFISVLFIVVSFLFSCSYASDFVNPFGLDKENPLGSIKKLDEQIRLLLAVERIETEKNVYKYKAKNTDDTITIDLDDNNKILRVSVHTVGQSSQVKSFFTAYWRKVNGSDAVPRQIPGSKSPDGGSFDRADLLTDAASGAWYIYQNSQELEISLKGHERLPRG